MDLRLLPRPSSAAVTCMRSSAFDRPDVAPEAQARLPGDSCGHCTRAKSSSSSSSACDASRLPLTPLPLPSRQSAIPAPLRFLWFSRTDPDQDVAKDGGLGEERNAGGSGGDLALDTQTDWLEEEPNTAQRSWFSAVPNLGHLWRRDDAEAELQQEQDCLSCGGCTLGLQDPDSGLPSGGRASVSYDRDSFANYLHHIQLPDLQLVAQMSVLCNLAYMISDIEPLDLLGEYRLNFVTSSLQRKVRAISCEVGNSPKPPAAAPSEPQDSVFDRLAGSVSFERAQSLAGVASLFWKKHTEGAATDADAAPSEDAPPVDPLQTRGEEEAFYVAPGLQLSTTDVASFIATSSAAVVLSSQDTANQAVGEEDMQHSCPCQWFICDDQDSHTRYFVIQGSESLASWQANLLFEPVHFEDPNLHVMVHRGIYEASKGLYEQLLPHVLEYLTCGPDGAHIRFTGHSLGGSLAMLITLMLQIREVVPSSSVLPVMTFGSPAVMCGGDILLRKLGLPLNHIQSIVMHRDIVPRSFSCDYPEHVAEVLRRINGTFRKHPCLSHEGLLYSPLGQLMILQPDNRHAPSHPFLPDGSGLYIMAQPDVGKSCTAPLLAAQRAFLNSPHPLEILSDPGAYGPEGAISRDHDPRSYVRAVKHVLRKEHKRWRRVRREQRRQLWGPLVCREASQRVHSRPVAGAVVNVS